MHTAEFMALLTVTGVDVLMGISTLIAASAGKGIELVFFCAGPSKPFPPFDSWDMGEGW